MKRCGACGKHGHMRVICPSVPYNGESLKDRRARQKKRALAQGREKHAQNKQPGKEANKRNYERHTEKRIAAVTVYRAANPDKVKAWRDKYWTENGARLKAERKLVRARLYAEDPKGSWLKYTFFSAQVRARKRGLSFDKDIPSIELPDVCPVLGITLVYPNGVDGKHSPSSPSLDRIRPELGYVAGNLRVISNRANTLKNNATLEEMRAVVRDMERSV